MDGKYFIASMSSSMTTAQGIMTSRGIMRATHAASFAVRIGELCQELRSRDYPRCGLLWVPRCWTDVVRCGLTSELAPRVETEAILTPAAIELKTG